MDAKQILTDILKDIQIKVSGEFDLNFERKAFFTDKWKPSKYGMIKSGNLRRSLVSQIQGESVRWSSSLPYASIHNSGGAIKVTAKMKKYFWAKYYECAGRIKKKKDGSPSVSKYNQRLGAEARLYKHLALMKAGSVIVMPKRQFIGGHPQVGEIVNQAVNRNLKNMIDNQLKNTFKK